MAAVLNHAVRRFLQTSSAKMVQVAGPSAVSGRAHDGGYKVWKRMTFIVALPAIILCAANCYLQHTQGDHSPPEFKKYEYMRVRTKRFPWGDGNRSLIHNPHTNALPDGYEHSEH